MTKLEFTVSAVTLNCIDIESKAASILGVGRENVDVGISICSLLADEDEFAKLYAEIEDLLRERPGTPDDDPSMVSPTGFRTMNLVFSAPGAPAASPEADRTPLDGVYASPTRAIHYSNEIHLSCFTHVELCGDVLHVTALEYSREHRKRLLEQEFGFWLLNEHIEKGVIATTVMGEVVYWNRYASVLYQWSKEEALGRNIMGLTPSDMTHEQAVQIMSTLGKGDHWRGMFRVKRKDGSGFLAHVSDTPIMSAEGEVKFIVGVSDDYTQLHDVMDRLEELNSNLEKEVQARTKQLLERETYLRMIGAAVNESDTGVMVTDGSYRITWSNEAVSKMLRVGDVVGSYPWDLPLRPQGAMAGLDCLTLKEFFDTTVNGQIMAVVPKGMLHVDSPVEVLSVNAQFLNGETEQHMVTLRDMTAIKKADAAQLAAEKAAAASRTKTEMMHVLSHELRTPLQGIMGVTSTLLEDMVPEDKGMYDNLSTILASSRTLLTLINNTLDSRKLESGASMKIDVTTIPTMECVRDSVRFCAPFASIHEVDLRVTADDAQCNQLAVRANRLRLQQVIVNLLSNAIKYTVTGTTVTVSVRECYSQEALDEACSAPSSDLSRMPSEQLKKLLEENNPKDKVVVISVSDQGKGIPSHEYGKVFGEFSQLSVSADMDRKYGGTKRGLEGQSSGSGLGLNIAYKFITRMAGHLWCKNSEEDGGGAVFSFCLPRSQVELSTATSSGVSERRSVEFRAESASQFRVLLVDDSIINLKVLARMFRRLGVDKIVSFPRGGKALEYLKSSETEPPNLILSDLQMPEMDGYELMGHLREVPMTELPFIVACTADWTGETEKKCLDVGFDGILRKPITFSDLKAFMVDSVLGASGHS